MLIGGRKRSRGKEEDQRVRQKRTGKEDFREFIRSLIERVSGVGAETTEGRELQPKSLRESEDDLPREEKQKLGLP